MGAPVPLMQTVTSYARDGLQATLKESHSSALVAVVIVSVGSLGES